MGKPTRNEFLADNLRAASVAAVWIDAEGHVGLRCPISFTSGEDTFQHYQ
jgi:hypothetical protein